MEIKIKKIYIQNFKAFEKFSCELGSDNIVVFDGPNGFGKTSFYDAVELLFTGSLRRYEELIGEVADGREKASGSPFLNYHSQSGDLIIKGELTIGEETFFFMRKKGREELDKVQSLSAIKLPLYVLDSFDADSLSPLNKDQEAEYLSKHLGNNYVRNFEFLNYIEQEENIYLLKSDDKKRKEAIAHLFNTTDFERRIENMESVLSEIKPLCGKGANDKLLALEAELDEYKKQVRLDAEAVPFNRLISWKDFFWDGEDIKVSNAQFIEWLKDDGTFARLSIFVSNRQEYRKYFENATLDKFADDKPLLQQFLLYWRFLGKQEELTQLADVRTTANAYLKDLDGGILTAVRENRFEIPSIIIPLLSSHVDINAYYKMIIEISEIGDQTDTLSGILLELKDTRDLLISRFNQCEGKITDSHSCPLCGHEWVDLEALKKGFSSHEEKLNELIKSTASALNTKIEQFKEKFFSPIAAILNEFILNNLIDYPFIQGLKVAATNRSNLSALNDVLIEYKIDPSLYLNTKAAMPEELKTETLREALLEKKSEIDSSQLRDFFDIYFLEFFDSSWEKLREINLESIAGKRKYVEGQFQIQQSTEIKNREEKIKEARDRLNRANSLKEKLTALKKIYESSLLDYQRRFIENIEILFHVYYGRISQETKGGLGLFIQSENGGIRFLESFSKKHDAVFTMSSGQLATLVISFTLALNKRFSHNKLLFIDDPVQTLDELNIAGFVELLRNEFSDRQLFISTHEDAMSAYMRYKFKKFNLDEQRIGFKEFQTSLIV